MKRRFVKQTCLNIYPGKKKDLLGRRKRNRQSDIDKKQRREPSPGKQKEKKKVRGRCLYRWGGEDKKQVNAGISYEKPTHRGERGERKK